MAVGAPDYIPRMFISGQSSQQVKVSVTDSDTTGTFSQEVKSFLLFNYGANDVHFELDATSTTNKFIVPNKSWIFVDLPVTVVHLICAAGETATCYLLGVY